MRFIGSVGIMFGFTVLTRVAGGDFLDGLVVSIGVGIAYFLLWIRIEETK